MVTAETKPSRPLMQTPCVKVCTLDARSGLCLGCGRTLDEIARWASMSEAERARIMAELARRTARGDAVATE
jgi:predicted Fe-S protein YdhL (DUF1289 family)